MMPSSSSFSPSRLLLLALAIVSLFVSNARAYPVQVRSSAVQDRPHHERRLTAAGFRELTERAHLEARPQDFPASHSWLLLKERSDEVSILVKAELAAQTAPTEAIQRSVVSAFKASLKPASVPKPKSVQNGAKSATVPTSRKDSAKAPAVAKPPANAPSAVKVLTKGSSDNKPHFKVPDATDSREKAPAAGKTSTKAPAAGEPTNKVPPATTTPPETETSTKKTLPEASASKQSGEGKSEPPTASKQCKRGLISLADVRLLPNDSLQKRDADANDVHFAIFLSRSLLASVEDHVNLETRGKNKPVAHSTYDPVDPYAVYTHPEEVNHVPLGPSAPAAPSSGQKTKQITGQDVNDAAFQNLNPAGTRPNKGYPKKGSGLKKGDPADPVPAGSTDISHWPIMSGAGVSGPTRGISYKPPGGGNHQIAVSYHDPNKSVGPKPPNGGPPPRNRPFTEAQPDDVLPAWFCQL